MSVILETKNLQKYFKTPKGYLHAVENVSLSLNKGETMGIVGESGCGKSTLGRTILHLLEPTGGQIFFEGKDITNVKGSELKALRRQMQIIFQDPFSSLNPRMTVGQIIAEPLRIYRITHSKEELNRRVAELIKKYPDAAVAIEGYTQRSTRNDFEVSQRRCDATRDYLISQGVDYKRLMTTGKGTESPRYDEKQRSNRAKNDRVEISITLQ